MKKLYTLFVALLIASSAITQTDDPCESCLPDGITFTTQAQIDSFQVNYPGCAEIEGDVLIGDWPSSDIDNLTGLNVLTSIGGGLEINYNDALPSLTGLDNMTSVGGWLVISWNDALTSLSGLDNVTSVGEGLTISGNDALTSLTGLENVTSVWGDLGIGYNPALTSLTGLDNLTSIGYDLIVDNNDALTNLTGLDNLIQIGGDLHIGTWGGGNDSLTSLRGLDNVTSIGGNLEVWFNESLTSFTGLNNLISVGVWLNIFGNDALTSLTGLDNLTSVGGNLGIMHNDTLISLTGLDNLTSVGEWLSIWDNDALCSLAGLDNVTSVGEGLSIEDNDALTSLSGLDNVNPNSINNLSISYNQSLSDCNVQSICDYLAAPNGAIDIYGNDTGCNNPLEIANACGFTMPCLPYGNYHFICQNDIDDFAISYPNCTEIEGDVVIHGENITNLNGLNVMTSVGGNLRIAYNDTLISLTGLDNLTSVGGGLNISENATLTSLTGLENVTSVGGELQINHNIALASLTGLENVTSVWGDLGIGCNPALTSLTGLDNIYAFSIENLYIVENQLLSSCEVESVCAYLTSPYGEIEIYGNATGCSSPEEVKDSCEAHAVFVNERHISNSLLIYPNPAKQKLNISAEGLTIDEVIIYSLTGQQVFASRPKSELIDISALKPGMYILEVIVENRKVRQKLLVQRQ